jgi:hypothetical protein
MSYHVIIDILTNPEVNKMIARLLDTKFGKFIDKAGKMKGIVDIAVYSRNHTMRLPGCIKISDEGSIDDRRFKISRESTIKDFFITYTRDITVKYIDNISFSSTCPISDAA